MLRRNSQGLSPGLFIPVILSTFPLITRFFLDIMSGILYNAPHLSGSKEDII